MSKNHRLVLRIENPIRNTTVMSFGQGSYSVTGQDIALTEVANGSSPDSREDDEAALESLYTSTNGGSWTDNTGWSSSGMSLSDSIFGVETETIGGELRVTSIEISTNNLVGSLPIEIGNLKQCTVFDVEQNLLTGSIPSEIGDMISLVNLLLAGNPSNFPDFGTGGYHAGKVDQVTNDFSGTLPTTIGNLVNLEIIRLERQGQMTGPIPSEFGNCTKLRAFLLYGEFNDHESGFTGEIPPSLGNLTDLVFLYIGRNAVEGALPEELGNLVNLKKIEFGATNITSFPESFKNMVSLKHMFGDQSAIDMPFPEFMFEDNRPEFSTFSFSWPEGPGFSGTLENVDFGNTDIEQFSVSGHSLTGAFPESLTGLDPIIWTCHFQQDGFGFTDLPQTGYNSWDKCRHFRFEDNNLQVPIPTDLVNVSGGPRRDCTFAENRLVPDDIIPALDAGIDNIWDSFNCDEQKPFGEARTESVASGGSVTIDDFDSRLSHADNSYQWEKDGVDISGETSKNITIDNFDASDEGDYKLKVSTTYSHVGFDQNYISEPITLQL